MPLVENAFDTDGEAANSFAGRVVDCVRDGSLDTRRLAVTWEPPENGPERSQLGFRPDYGKRCRRPAARQSRDIDSPARSGAYAASLRDTNSVKSRTRFVLRVSPC